MKPKIIAIIAVAVVVIAGVAAALVLTSDNGSKDRHDDYAMLADSSNFTKGFSYFLDSTYEGGTIESFKVTIDNRVDDRVDYTLGYRNYRTETGFSKSDFLSAFQFSVDDAAADLPEGISVNHGGNVYAITGSEVIKGYHGFTCRVDFSNVVLTTDGSDVFTDGSGTVTFVSDDQIKAGSLNIVYTFSTNEGACEADVKLTEITPDTGYVDELFSYPIMPHTLYLSDYSYYSPVKSGETRKIGNVDCDVYTYTVIDETYSVCVYEGIILLKERTSGAMITEALHVDKS